MDITTFKTEIEYEQYITNNYPRVTLILIVIWLLNLKHSV